MTCYKCKSEYTVKNGHRKGKQCYLCKICGTQFTGDHTFIENEKRVALTLCCFGFSMRKIGDLLGYSHVTILNWVREFEEKREQDVEQKIFNEDYFLSIDEMCEFLSKRNQNSRLGKRFPSMQDALTWNVENEMSKVLEKLFATLTK